MGVRAEGFKVRSYTMPPLALSVVARGWGSLEGSRSGAHLELFLRGWVTFDRSVNIKEICWNLQNIRVSAGRGTAEEEAVGLSMPRTTSDSGALGPFL